MPSTSWSNPACGHVSINRCRAAPHLPNGAFVAGSVKAAVLKAGTVATGGQEAMVSKTYKQQMDENDSSAPMSPMKSFVEQMDTV